MTEELKEAVEKDGPLKTMFIDYVGTVMNLDPDKESVTLEMIIEVLSKEFPDFILAIAEENWLRGYQQAILDVETYNDAKDNLEEESIKRGIEQSNNGETTILDLDSLVKNEC